MKKTEPAGEKPAETPGAESVAPTATPPIKEGKRAKVLVLKTRTPLLDFYRKEGAVVEGVPVADAEFKEGKGLVRILEIKD